MDPERSLMYKGQLRWQPIVILLILAMFWGANIAMVKIGTREVSPLFMAGLRSAVASICLYIWMKAKRLPAFPSTIVLFHGIVVGLLFGAEFGLLFVGLQHTLASRLYVLLYTAPFFTAISAHFFLKDDRLNIWKVIGLCFAFFGILLLFLENFGTLSLDLLTGDLMIIGGGALWAVTTVYLKKYLTHRTEPLQTLFYQVFFSAPFLFVLSLLWEDPMISSFSAMAGFSLFYQGVIIAFLTYLIWFELIHRYPVSLLHAFAFFTPVFGVAVSGALILGEPIHLNLVLALVLVSLGMTFVNRQPRDPAPVRQTDS